MDAIAEARAAFITALANLNTAMQRYYVVPLDANGRVMLDAVKEATAAADRYALAVLEEAIPEGGVIWLRKRKALIRARIVEEAQG